MKRALPLVLVALLVPITAHADQGSFTNSGGSSSGGGGIFISSSVTNPAGMLSLSCVGTTAGQCSGGSLSYQSGDGVTIISAVFTSGTYVEGCSGGRGGHISCAWSFSGQFSGTAVINGQPQAINGATSQYFSTTGSGGSGSTGWNSAYTPFYYSDSEQILRSDDLIGTNQITYGSQGSGVGNFYGAYGIALDSAGRIYVADTYNCRIVRIDDINGTNWTEYDSAGGCGNGTGQFYEPTAIAIDTAGRIYVTDPYNAQIIRMDDLTGANWTVFSNTGSGDGQISSYTNIALDSSNRIYIADGGNKRVVRMDDLAGTNFTTLTQSQPSGIYIYLFSSPIAVAVDPTGKIYVADGGGTPRIIRVDDMTGANWSSIATNGNGLNSIAVDSTGTVFAGGGGAHIDDGNAAVLNSSGAIAPYGPYYVFGLTPVPVPIPRPSAVSFSPTTLTFMQNIGGSSTQPITITNFGSSSLNVSALTASAGFTESDNCLGALTPGRTCTANVSFAPSVTGDASGFLTVTDDSGNQGFGQAIPLSGTGTAPTASVTPVSLSFSSTVVGSTSSARTISVQSTGTGPLTVASVASSGPFTQTNSCVGVLQPATSCTVSVTFSPTAIGAASGSVTITDDAGTQTVTLSGSGSAPVSVSTTSLSFGSLAVGDTSTAKSVTVTNRQKVVLNFSGISASSPFLIASNTCGASIAANASCSVGIEFSPTALGAVSGALTIADDAAFSPQTVALTGTGSAPVTLSTSSINFNNTVVGAASKTSSVTLTNNQNVALNFGGISASAGFAIASNTCGASIAAGAKCSVGVTFDPTALGAASGTLVFTDDAGTQTVALGGTGIAPVTLSTASISFGTITVGTTSSSHSVTLTNNQSAALTFSSIATSPGFNISSNSCGSGIAAGARCSVSITFHPTASGVATGTLTFTDNSPNGPQTVSLNGSGR